MRRLYDDLLQRADDGDGVEVVEEAEVRDAEDLALHLALAVGDDGAKRSLELLDDGAGVHAFGRQTAVAAAAGAGRREQREAQSAERGAVMAAQVSALSISVMRPSARSPSACAAM